MAELDARLIGVELYFEDLPRALRFYQETLGLHGFRAEAGRYAQLGRKGAFLCLEKKGVESYRSRDKAVIFLEVTDLRQALEMLGQEGIMPVETGTRERGSPWAVLHDPEGHNVLLVETEANPASLNARS